jgi:DNA (cytosine-5)-methyltransferase 1
VNKLSLFSGIGGDDLASEWAGIETVCFVEIDKYCQKVLKKHWPDIPIIEDVKDVTKKKVKAITGREWFDIISGGDPCQPRSLTGKRRGREDNRDLWPDMFKVIRRFKPAWVINENPTGRLSMDFKDVLSDLESAGYETRSFIIPACAVNAYHLRERLFIVAYSNRHSLQSRPESRPERCKESGEKQLAGFLQFGIKPSISIARTYRAGHGVNSRMDRRRNEILGNAVVPQQIYPIYKAIVEVENTGVRKGT